MKKTSTIFVIGAHPKVNLSVCSSDTIQLAKFPANERVFQLYPHVPLPIEIRQGHSSGRDTSWATTTTKLKLPIRPTRTSAQRFARKLWLPVRINAFFVVCWHFWTSVISSFKFCGQRRHIQQWHIKFIVVARHNCMSQQQPTTTRRLFEINSSRNNANYKYNC